MDTAQFIQRSEDCWEIEANGAMRVPAVIYADETLLKAMDQKVYEQISNIAALPGIVEAAYAKTSARWWKSRTGPDWPAKSRGSNR